MAAKVEVNPQLDPPTHLDAPAETAEPFAALAERDPGPGRPLPLAAAGRMAGFTPRGPLWGVEMSLEAITPRVPPARPRPQLGLQGEGPTFSMARFADAIRARVDGQCKGWAFVLNQNGEEAVAVAGGEAVTAEDLDGDGLPIGQRCMTLDTRVNLASVSKRITAVAVIRLLREAGFTPQDRIWPFLPEDWTRGERVNDITFHQLLTHTAGLDISAAQQQGLNIASYEGLRAIVGCPANPGAPHLYGQGSYNMFRLLIPGLWRFAGRPDANNASAIAAGFYYAVYVIQEVFGRMGGAIGPDASTSPLGDNQARYYESAEATEGNGLGNWALTAGGGGWHLTARELAAFLAFVEHGDAILTQDERDLMDAERYGWKYSPLQGAFGTYLSHDGAVGEPGTVRTSVMKFNLDIEAALVMNSALGGKNPGLGNVLRNAFDAAWV